MIKHTILNLLDLTGALGLNTPDELNHSHLYRVITDHRSKNYQELFPCFNGGELLSENIPEELRDDWQHAKAEKF